MSTVAKVYRVTVKQSYRRDDAEPGVYFVTSRATVNNMWRYYARKYRDRLAAGADVSRGVFKVEVAPSAVFKDISALYQMGDDE